MSDTPRSPWLALGVVCTGLLMIILDGMIVTVALPSIQRDLAFSPSSVTWIVNGYLIAFGGLLLLAGRLGDLIGRKRMFVIGLVVFTVASMACGLSVSPMTLIVARFAQGVGGAMASGVSLGVIVTLFPDPGERAKAFGAFSFVGAGGASLGQVLGGVLTETLGWEWVFYVNLPIGLFAAGAASRVLAADRGAGLRKGADVIGAILVTSGLMVGIYTIVEGAGYDWGSLTTILLGAFALRQFTAANPLLPPRLLASREVAAANVVQALVVFTQIAFQVLIVLYLQDVLGYTAIETGLAMLPAAVVIGAAALFVAARSIARFGERNVLRAGILLLCAGIGLLTRMPSDNAIYVIDLLPTMVLVGGFGLAITALTGLGMSTARPDDAGLASGLFNTTQQVGAAVGVAVLSTLATTRSDSLAAAGLGREAAMTSGFHFAFAVGAGVLIAAMVTAAALPNQRARTASGRARK
jgi:EmrB/QacA subfamily drug resistance transporter